MNIEEFNGQYRSYTSRDYIDIVCDRCKNTKNLQKHKAKENIEKNNVYVCHHCRSIEVNPLRTYTEEGLKRVVEGASYKRTDVTKKRMSAAKIEFFKTPAGEELKIKLSALAAQGHAEHRFDNAKRNGWYESPKAGRVVYGSSYELLLCTMLDGDEDVKTYQTQVLYSVSNRSRCLDFLITYVDGSKEAIEVKPLTRLNEQENIEQISDSALNADNEGWDFDVYTEEHFGMTCKEIRDWADEFLTKTGSIDLVSWRKELHCKRAKTYYEKAIKTNTVEVWCEFCGTHHTPLKQTYDKAIAKNGRFICEREGGHIAGSRPKPHLRKDNPHVAEGKKECTKCHEVKPLNDFGDDKSRRDGKASRCKTCRKSNP